MNSILFVVLGLIVFNVDLAFGKLSIDLIYINRNKSDLKSIY